MKIAFDIGGVLSKYPDVFRPLFMALVAAPDIEVFVISDMKPREKAAAFCKDNGFLCGDGHIAVADYETYGERCKAVLCERLGIDLLIDDHAGYLAVLGQPMVRLLVMPDPDEPYYHDSWKTDGSEGIFGRRNPPGSKRPPENRKGQRKS